MPIPTIRYANNERAAQAVIRHIGALMPPVRYLRSRPSNTSARAFADWWLLPGIGRPEPGHGRLYLHRLPDTKTATAPGLMSAGFCVERGLGRQLGSSLLGEPEQLNLVDPRLVMQPAWLWYRFLNDALGGLFDSPMRTVLSRSGQPITVSLDLFRADSLPANLACQGLQDDHLSFAVLDDTLLLHPTQVATAELAVLDDAATLRELVIRMEGVQDLSWYWILVSLGIEVAYGHEESDWDAGELWHNALEPWLPWVH